jgi:uncharacterized protein (TIGR01777 family)
MKIAVTGSTGLVGTEVVQYFQNKGDTVLRLVRKASCAEDEVFWNPAERKINHQKLEGVDAVVHLAGANIAQRRWSLAFKDQILSSRIDGTRLISEAVSILKNPPKVLICASAVGYYGNQDAVKMIDETNEAGRDFLANVCVEWEKAAQPAVAGAVRVVYLRLGMVISKNGGALKKMLPVFKLGLGGNVGSGQQMMSWIALTEIPKLIEHVIGNPTINGPVNATTPNPVSNAEFTSLLGKAIQRPVIFPFPVFMVKLILGEMGETLLLGGARVLPKKLLDSGYHFKYPDLSSAFSKELSR